MNTIHWILIIIGVIILYVIYWIIGYLYNYKKCLKVEIDERGYIKFKRLYQFNKHYNLPEDFTTGLFALINSKLKIKATAKELMYEIGKLLKGNHKRADSINKFFCKTEKTYNTIGEACFDCVQNTILKDHPVFGIKE